MKKRSAANKGGSTHHELVQIDFSFPRFALDLQQLELDQVLEFRRCIDKIKQMTWAQILATSSKTEKRGLNWEPLEQRTISGGVIASIRITQKFRARVTREGAMMRFISLHPDHDSAYEEAGGEDL